ncbi:MAG: hypothetical protein V1754_07650 [Pseudomonadota bacterium]
MNFLKRVAPIWMIVSFFGCEQPSRPNQVGAFVVTIVNGDQGTQKNPRVFSTDLVEYTVNIEARTNDGTNKLDDSFNGWVVVSVLPTGKLEQDPLAVEMKNGKAQNVKVAFKMAFGPVRIVVTEEGYTPRINDPGNSVCLNGKDDDADGYADFPADKGCFYANDENEEGGGGAVGATESIFFANPRIEDVQKPSSIGAGGDASVLYQQRIIVDRGWLMVARVGVDGLYVTDMDGVTWDGAQFTVDPLLLSYRSVFAFNFSTPLNLQEGDCLVQLDGTVEEFYGFTEIGKPTWKKGDYEFCAAKARAAGLSEAECPKDEIGSNEAQAVQCRVTVENLANTPMDITKMVIEVDRVERSVWDDRFLELERYEAALVQVSDVNVFDELRECDVNGNGVVDWSSDQESDCSNDCGDTAGCVVWETYSRYQQWTVTFTDGLGEKRELAVVSVGAIPDFDPVKSPGKKLGKLVGTLRHISFGRPAWILEPRRVADCPDCKNE